MPVSPLFIVIPIGLQSARIFFSNFSAASERWSYKDNRLQLESGDRLVLFTVGVTEDEDAHGAEFGEERVVRALLESGGRSAEDVHRKLMEAVTAYCGSQSRDDATVVVLAVQ